MYALALLSNDKGEILLIRRKNVTFGDGLYSMPGGTVEQGETARQAAVRELHEEVGLNIPELNFELVHTFHRKGTETEFVSLIFKTDITGMHPQNKEVEKHDDMRWFNINQLPENIIPAHKQAIECIVKGLSYSEHGW